ncbi:putative quinol monooxygenase [Nonomuraea sp. NPDC050786]|uniref:putative quinol monooxygenase n=1 Tax=Nonomuraea sp. NPDC050786 TaxID=3154840 RepID=UPI0033D15CEF
MDRRTLDGVSQTPDTDAGPLCLYGFFRPRVERAEQLRQLLLSLVEPSRKEPGCLQYNVTAEADGSLFVYEIWRSRKNLELHKRTPHMIEFARIFWEHRSEFLRDEIESHSGLLLEP